MNTGSIPNDSFLNKKIKTFKIKIWKSSNSYKHIIKTNKRNKNFYQILLCVTFYTTTKSYKSSNLEETKMPFEKPENWEFSTVDLLHKKKKKKKRCQGSLLFSLKLDFFFQIFE